MKFSLQYHVVAYLKTLTDSDRIKQVSSVLRSTATEWIQPPTVLSP